MVLAPRAARRTHFLEQVHQHLLRPRRQQPEPFEQDLLGPVLRVDVELERGNRIRMRPARAPFAPPCGEPLKADAGRGGDFLQARRARAGAVGMLPLRGRTWRHAHALGQRTLGQLGIAPGDADAPCQLDAIVRSRS